jgi:hypothetical protein
MAIELPEAQKFAEQMDNELTRKTIASVSL